MFKVLTICRNTSVETSHYGFPDAFQLERVRESMMRHLTGCVAANGQHFEHLM
jgi:hypothetical protein